MAKWIDGWAILITGLLLLQPPAAMADTARAAFEKGLKQAAVLRGKAFDTLKIWQPETAIQGYTDRPAETAYQHDPDAIKRDGEHAVQTDPTGRQIVSGIQHREEAYHFSKDPNSSAIQRIRKRGDAMYDVITGAYGDCTKQTQCETRYETHTCDETPASTQPYCNKTLNIDMVPTVTEKRYPLSAHLSVKDHHYAGVSIDAVTGSIHFLGPHDARVQLTGRLPLGLPCEQMSGRVISRQGDAVLDSIDFPTCQNAFVLAFHFSNGHRLDLQLEIIAKQTSWEPKDKWNNQCSVFEQSARCTLQTERCVEPGSTKHIQGMPVTRDCWEKELGWQCGSETVLDDCRPWREKGCEQTGSVCQSHADGGCERYQQVFRCAVRQCTVAGMVCHGETYCLDGDCINQHKNADPDFQRAVSALSATQAAAKDFTQFQSIFAGIQKSCDRFALGFLDCCADKGWGKDHIVSCSQAEKDLKTDKTNLLTVYVGQYCKKDPMGVCVEKRKAYCVFPSRLARIIQVQGRRDQLHIGFGDPEHPDCRGLTREEFARLDLGSMDFSDFYADIASKQRIENTDQLTGRIRQRAQEWEEGQTPNG